MDDYGTGLNDLNIVEMYDPHMVKLDRELISDIDSDTVKQENISALLQMFHDRGIKVVAEGVETKEDFDTLRQMGCDFIQGFYFSKPLPEDLFLEYLKNFKWTRYISSV